MPLRADEGVMSQRPDEGTLVLLDACCVINLFATGRIKEILRLLPYRFAVSRLVADEEVLSIRRDADPAEHPDREAVSPRELESSGCLAIMDVGTPEEKTEFARFAVELDDGEASSCALAVVHGGGVATDDRKALRVLDRLALQVPALQTPELLHEWARRSRAPSEEVRAALLGIRDRARFYPGRATPHYSWWAGFFTDN